MKRGSPHFDLSDVQRLASSALVIRRSRALDPLIAHCGSPKAARRFAKEVIKALTVDSFSETLTQRFDQKFDVYGVRRDEKVWYVKLTIEIDMDGEDMLLVISFHESERTMRTNKGELKP